MPFSPVEKNWRIQREMIVLENGIQYYQVTEYHYGKDLLKAIHYVVLLMSSEDNDKEDTNE